jgi:hypothetical protein
VVGSINPLYASYDAQGNIINEPYPTGFPQGGFDLDAVGVIHQQPLSVDELIESHFTVYPNPVSDILTIENSFQKTCTLTLYNPQGQIVYEILTNNTTTFSMKDLPSGIYILSIKGNSEYGNLKIVHL